MFVTTPVESSSVEHLKKAHTGRIRKYTTHFHLCRTPADAVLVSNVDRKEIDQYSKQRQSRNAVRGKHPGAAAFVLRTRRLRSSFRGITRSPMFHANLQKVPRTVMAKKTAQFARVNNPGKRDGGNITTDVAPQTQITADFAKSTKAPGRWPSRPTQKGSNDRSPSLTDKSIATLRRHDLEVYKFGTRL
jgi:hypothetical protein